MSLKFWEDFPARSAGENFRGAFCDCTALKMLKNYVPARSAGKKISVCFCGCTRLNIALRPGQDEPGLKVLRSVENKIIKERQVKSRKSQIEKGANATK